MWNQKSMVSYFTLYILHHVHTQHNLSYVKHGRCYMLHWIMSHQITSCEITLQNLLLPKPQSFPKPNQNNANHVMTKVQYACPWYSPRVIYNMLFWESLTIDIFTHLGMRMCFSPTQVYHQFVCFCCVFGIDLLDPVIPLLPSVSFLSWISSLVLECICDLSDCLGCVLALSVLVTEVV